MASNIVDLSTAVTLEPKNDQRSCHCRQVWVDAKTRMLECKACGRTIDPFDYLMNQAQQQKTSVLELQIAKDAFNKLQEDLQRLHKERKELIAQIEQAKEKVQQDPTKNRRD